MKQSYTKDSKVDIEDFLMQKLLFVIERGISVEEVKRAEYDTDTNQLTLYGVTGNVYRVMVQQIN